MKRPDEQDRPLFDPSRMRAADLREPSDAQRAAQQAAAVTHDAAAHVAAPGSQESAPLTVTRLNQLIRGALASAFPSTIHVVGELSNVTAAGTGHRYFTLKDGTGELRCVMWRSDALRLKFNLTDGLEVIASGKVDVYEQRGHVQLYVKRVQPRGVGALELAFRQLRERLEKEGLFDPARKRPIPAMPRTIGLVTSPTGAAIDDILTTIRRRFPKVRVLIAGVRVQGDGAADEIAAAIQRFNNAARRLGGVDVLIVGRGGGSLEDLWAFNEEKVARAVAASTIPIISAVGHEVDFSIADFAADLRAPTPTAAAELAVPLLSDLAARIDSAESRMRRGLSSRITQMRARLNAVARSRWFRDPVGSVRRRHQHLDELCGRLRLVTHRAVTGLRRRVGDAELRLMKGRPVVQLARRRRRVDNADHRLLWSIRERCVSSRRRVDDLAARLRAGSPRFTIRRERDRLDGLQRRLVRAMAAMRATARRRLIAGEARLNAASPESVLSRGFSITRRMRGGAIVRASDEVKPGDRIETETAAGKIHSRVLDSRQGEMFE